MARTVEQIVQEQLGSLMLQIAKMAAEAEIAQEHIKELEAAAKAKDAPQG